MERSVADLTWLPAAPEDFNARVKALSPETDGLGMRIQQLASYRLNAPQGAAVGRAVKRAIKTGISLDPLSRFRLGVLASMTFDLLIDAIIGHGLRGDPRGPARSLIQLANSNAAPILSLDLPSGVDSEGGRLFDPHVRAAATLALALPKAGLCAPAAAAVCGDLYLAGIGAPAALWARLGIDGGPLFGCNSSMPLDVVNGVVAIRE